MRGHDIYFYREIGKLSQNYLKNFSLSLCYEMRSRSLKLHQYFALSNCEPVLVW